MFDRVKYKSFAKQQLSGRYTVPILILIFTSVIELLLQIPMRSLNNEMLAVSSSLEASGDITYVYSAFRMLLLFQAICWVIAIVDFIFMLATIHVYIKMSRSPDPVKFSDFIEGLGSWGRAILAGLWQTLFICLWTFLFIIPGLIKAYSYSQMFYLVDEFQGMKIRKAMKISMKITKGHKMDLFILDLSFLGWALLSVCTFGLASLYVTPYIEMTKVNAFHALLKEAVENGTVTLEELHEGEPAKVETVKVSESQVIEEKPQDKTEENSSEEKDE